MQMDEEVGKVAATVPVIICILCLKHIILIVVAFFFQLLEILLIFNFGLYWQSPRKLSVESTVETINYFDESKRCIASIGISYD
jgi:hypothetical protein